VECLICGVAEPEFMCEAQLYPGKVMNIVNCPECDASYYDPVPPPEEIARCYPHAYFGDFFNQYWKDVYKGRFLAESLSAWRPVGRIVDVGCALGSLLKGVRDHSRWEVVGVEFSRAAAEAGSKLNGVDIHAGALADSPIEAESLDYVHMNNVLEHEADPKGALEAAVAKLKPGGRLHLTIPNGPVDLYPTAALYHKDGKPRITRHGGHLFFLSREALEALLGRVGLSVLRIRNFHFQSGLKAHGLKPGAWRLFKNEPPSPEKDETESMPLEELKKRIGDPPDWNAYRLKSLYRRLWRFSGFDWGYDYEILAEKPAPS
jgi:SAM-dependent methyltransferase